MSRSTSGSRSRSTEDSSRGGSGGGVAIERRCGFTGHAGLIASGTEFELHRTGQILIAHPLLRDAMLRLRLHSPCQRKWAIGPLKHGEMSLHP